MKTLNIEISTDSSCYFRRHLGSKVLELKLPFWRLVIARLSMLHQFEAASTFTSMLCTIDQSNVISRQLILKDSTEEEFSRKLVYLKRKYVSEDEEIADMKSFNEKQAG